MAPQLASSLDQVTPSRIRELADIAFTIPGVLRLHFGESNMPTPRFIKDAAVQALSEGYTFYTENAGLPGLRERIAAKYQTLHGVDLKPLEEIVITASGVQALNVSIRCAIDPGDEALILTPNWPNATAIVGMFGGVPREIPLSWQGERYTIDFDALTSALGPKTRLLVCTSPSNPLGWVATVEEQIKMLTEEKPRLLVGYASIILEIARKITPEDLKSLNIKLISVNSEMSTQDQRDFISGVFGCPVYDEYSTEETWMISSQWLKFQPIRMTSPAVWIMTNPLNDNCFNSSRTSTFESPNNSQSG